MKIKNKKTLHRHPLPSIPRLRRGPRMAAGHGKTAAEDSGDPAAQPSHGAPAVAALFGQSRSSGQNGVGELVPKRAGAGHGYHDTLPRPHLLCLRLRQVEPTHYIKSKWREIWVRGVFWVRHLGSRCWGQNTSRIQHKEVLTPSKL